MFAPAPLPPRFATEEEHRPLPVLKAQNVVLAESVKTRPTL